MQGRTGYRLADFSTERKGGQKMNPATRGSEVNAVGRTLYMALALSNKSWNAVRLRGSEPQHPLEPVGHRRPIRRARGLGEHGATALGLGALV